MGEVCQVYCRSGTCDLDAVARSMAGCGLTVTHESDHLTAGWPGGPQFRVWLDAGEHVRAEAIEIGKETPHEAAMRECDARFDIGMDDLDEALDEINTLIEVRTAVQDASQGDLFMPWNNNLSEP